METRVGKRVQFSFIEAAMEVRTDNSQLIKLGDVRDPISVWLPLSLITVYPDLERPGYVVVTMPEWLFLKNSILVEFTDFHAF